MTYAKEKINWPIIFVFILFLNYLIPLLLFGNITLFYHDSLDHEIVLNNILGKIYQGNLEALNLLLNGEIKIEYLRRLFHPISLLYVFNTEVAYWLIDILVKLTSFISFYVLSKKITKNYFIASLLSCLFASINLPTHEHFGLAIMPYIFYLIIFKTNLSFKNYLIVFLSSLNSDFVMTFLPLISLSLIIFFYSKNYKFFIKKKFLIYTVFIFGLILSNANLFYLALTSVELHRIEFIKNPISFSTYFINLLNIPTFLDWRTFYVLPFTLIIIPLIVASFINFKNPTIFRMLIVFFIISSLVFILQTELITNILNSSRGLLKQFSWTRIQNIYPFLFSFICLIIISKNLKGKKILILFILSSVFMSQINSSITPFYKTYILKKENYKNIYTFEGYYNYEEYKFVKEIIGNKRSISIGLDPMIAVMNNISVIDGYHNIYPLSYKKKFRKVVEEELNKNEMIKNYYDSWGSRVLAFVNDYQNIQISFKEAKRIGADYVISNNEILSKKLIAEYANKKNDIFVYKIK